MSLFDAPRPETRTENPNVNDPIRSGPDPDLLDDTALVTAFRVSTLYETTRLAVEIVRRRPPGAAEAAWHVWARFQGFGQTSPLPEQEAVLDLAAALQERDLLKRIIDRGEVPPGLHAELLRAAASCELPLDPHLVRVGLRDRDAVLRVAALQIALLSDVDLIELMPLLQDRDGTVRNLAAVMLAEAGVEQARGPLLQALKAYPTRRGLEALALYQDEEALIRLGQLARANPKLVGLIRPLIEEFDDPRVASILAALPTQA